MGGNNLDTYLKHFSKTDKLVMVGSKQQTGETYVLPLKNLVDICGRHAMNCGRLDLALKMNHLLSENKNCKLKKKTKSST